MAARCDERGPWARPGCQPANFIHDTFTFRDRNGVCTSLPLVLLLKTSAIFEHSNLQESLAAALKNIRS
jgi:hypothetical protein